MSVEIKDKKGRTLLHMNRKGKLALSRFTDLSETEISNLVEFYCGLDEEASPYKIEQFLRFEEDDEKFCS
jgi:hypothetical protein